jgi:conjugative relaxase-like TrwC/TraI family protein
VVNISKPISSGQLKQYYKADFSNARENYYTEGATVCGEFHGKLAARWGLQGEVSEEQFGRLAEGQHPVTGEQLVRHQRSVEYVNGKGEKLRTMEHRSCYDATWSASKSISLVALEHYSFRCSSISKPEPCLSIVC